jgi:hypothetical protein
VYSAAQADGSPLPNAISLIKENGTQILRLSETDPALTGVYTVQITVVDPKSGIWNSVLTVNVIIKCTKSITLITDEIPYNVNPTFCLKQPFELSIIYVGVPVGSALPTWLSYDQSTVIMNISDELGVNAYNF